MSIELVPPLPAAQPTVKHSWVPPLLERAATLWTLIITLPRVLNSLTDLKMHDFINGLACSYC